MIIDDYIAAIVLIAFCVMVVILLVRWYKEKMEVKKINILPLPQSNLKLILEIKKIEKAVIMSTAIPEHLLYCKKEKR